MPRTGRSAASWTTDSSRIGDETVHERAHRAASRWCYFSLAIHVNRRVTAQAGVLVCVEKLKSPLPSADSPVILPLRTNATVAKPRPVVDDA